MPPGWTISIDDDEGDGEEEDSDECSNAVAATDFSPDEFIDSIADYSERCSGTVDADGNIVTSVLYFGIGAVDTAVTIELVEIIDGRL